MRFPKLSEVYGMDVVGTFPEHRLVVSGCCDCRDCSFSLYSKDEEMCTNTVTLKAKLLGLGSCVYRPLFLPPCYRCSQPFAKICSEQFCEGQSHEVGLGDSSSGSGSGSSSDAGSAA